MLELWYKFKGQLILGFKTDAETTISWLKADVSLTDN